MLTTLLADISAPPTIALTSNEMRVVLSPEIGGSIAEFSSTRAGVTQHWLRPASAASLAARDPLGMASFPLLPWCNRIRDGKTSYAGTSITLEPNFAQSPHTIHGVGWTRAWDVVSTQPDQAVLQLHHEKSQWPYRFAAQQKFRIDDADGLTVEISITNLDDIPMPAGIGHHPYLPRHAGAIVKVDLDAMWESDASLLPTQLSQPTVLNALRAGCQVDDLDLDNNFTGWAHTSRVEWPSRGTALELSAQKPLDFFVIYSRPQLDHFCIEPVSNCTDWMNLPHVDRAHIGGQLLAPGEHLHASFTLRPEWPV